MNIRKSFVSIGCDFEMFIVDKNGKTLSAIPFNRGTKEFPEEIGREGCCIQRDGVLQECNVPQVGLDEAATFWDNVEFVKDHVTRMIKGQGKLVCCPTSILTEDQLIEEEARTFGCSPDFNAWDDGNLNEKERDSETKLRSCGGHIHISSPDNMTINDAINIMKVFDIFLTVPYVLIDEDKLRRKLYGNAGAFRFRYYGDTPGFEARTLSNIWLKDKEGVEYVFHQLNKMFDFYNETDISKEVDPWKEKIVKCINESDEDLATEICEHFSVTVPLETIRKYERRLEKV
jgi:hypothetical protein